MDQLSLRNRHAMGMYWRPLIDLDIAKKYEKFLTTEMDEAHKKDFSKAVKALEDYEKTYQFMALGSQIHTTFQMLYRTMNQNFPVPSAAWRYSPEYDMDKKVFEAEALFSVYFRMLEAAKSNPEWTKKIELDLGKHMNFLFGLFPAGIHKKYVNDLPYMTKFVFFIIVKEILILINRKLKR